MKQMRVKSVPKPSDHHIPIDRLYEQKWKKGEEVLMNLIKCFQFPNKKITIYGVPKPDTQKDQKYWDKVCEQNPAKPGCKIYEN